MTGARRAAAEPSHDVDNPSQTFSELRPVSGRPPLPEYLRQLWQRRHFISERAWSLAITSNRSFALGNLWLVLSPLMDAAIYMMVFGFIFKPSMENFSSYLVIGIFMFAVSSRDVTTGAGCMRANAGLIRAFMFPRAAIPLAIVVRNVIEAIPTMLVMLLLVSVMMGPPGPAALLVPFVFALQVVFNFGLTCLSARIGWASPDLTKIIPMVFRVLIYGSAVMFAPQRYEAIPWLASTLHANPFFMMIDMYRALLMHHTVPPASQWMEFSLWALCSAVIGFWIFWRGEATYGRPD